MGPYIERSHMDKYDRTWFFLSITIGLIAICLSTTVWEKPEEPKQEIDFSKYIVEEEKDVYSEVYGAEPTTDFIPAHYLGKEEVNPYPGSIEKHIEATAYCYGTTTYTGKPVREGIAAMSKRYLGMTAHVYTEDENGNALDYIGTYEIEDTGGDYRIRNGNCIDIYIPDYDKAIEFGRQNVVVYLIEAKG